MLHRKLLLGLVPDCEEGLESTGLRGQRKLINLWRCRGSVLEIDVPLLIVVELGLQKL